MKKGSNKIETEERKEKIGKEGRKQRKEGTKE